MSKATKRRWLIWGVVAVVGLILLASAFRPRAVPVDMVSVSQGPLQVTVSHEGQTRAREPFVVSAPLAGRVLRIELEPGDPVIAGETVLATFVPSEPVMLDARTRARARAQMEAATASLARARSERDRARTEADFALAELERTRGLTAGGFVSQHEIQNAETSAQATSETLQAADSAVRAALHDLEAANAALLEPVSGSAVGPEGPVLELRSPVDGVVLRRLRRSEAVVPQGEPLVEVADPAQLEVVADYLSSDAVAMRPGMPVIIDRWGGDEPLHGRVRLVEPAGFMKISALGVEEQRVWVVIDIVDPLESWQTLGDGYRVESKVVIWSADEVIRVPTAALFRAGDGWAVFVAEDGRARVRAVEIGRRNGLQAELKEGLEEGDLVVIHPPDTVIDGVRIEQRGG